MINTLSSDEFEIGALSRISKANETQVVANACLSFKPNFYCSVF